MVLKESFLLVNEDFCEKFNILLSLHNELLTNDRTGVFLI